MDKLDDSDSNYIHDDDGLLKDSVLNVDNSATNLDKMMQTPSIHKQ